MGRRKQPRPHRSGAPKSVTENPDSKHNKVSGKNGVEGEIEVQPYFVEIDRVSWVLSNDRLDVAEIFVRGSSSGDGNSGCVVVDEGFYRDSRWFSRFRLLNLDKRAIARVRLGHWGLVRVDDVVFEVVERERESEVVVFSGGFDGPDEGVTGLVHLAKLGYVAVRPVFGEVLLNGAVSIRVRVEMLKSVFDACDSVLDDGRHLWKKSMMNVMAWLRPEVTTSEAKYGGNGSSDVEIESRKCKRFDAAEFYEAIKPSKEEPMLECEMPDLLPELRPYQRRAAYWMVQREKRLLGCVGDTGKENNVLCSPFCVPVKFVDSSSMMFYNPFSGNVSLTPEESSPYVSGGILADEMGLGKTVELLACIFAHPKSGSEANIIHVDDMKTTGDRRTNIRRLKRERVECICGAVSESRRYKGLWVQCDICDAWQHADCVGYSPGGKTIKSKEESDGRRCKKKSTTYLEKHNCKKSTANIIARDGEHICQLCSELITATDSPVDTGATLIVCPATILPQWHSEILRHTNPDSLRVFVYEGVRNASLTNTSVMDIDELISSDIVLTTYDVLKEDLSHDFDRHEGDRHVLRFQKRYPVVPTPLTRLFWWRICLDEAQMVESNAATATEMALRLYSQHRWCVTGTPIQHKLDDLFGLLRFLKASPFDVLRWWTDVIRDPYEMRDRRAMKYTHKFIKQIMWRSSKEHVADELQLPPQEACLSWLSFSPVEEHFYQRQHETCMGYALELIEGLKEDIRKREIPGVASSDSTFNPLITHVEATKLLNSLLKLRQACCHPQVGSSGLRSLQSSPMTMEEILSVLVEKTKIEGEEALRRLTVALNALAAIAIIQNNHSDAVALYKEALDLAKEHSVDFRLDPLLNIHIHHNLSEVLSVTLNNSGKHCLEEQIFSGNPKHKDSEIYDVKECEHIAKRRKVSAENDSASGANSYDLPVNGLKFEGEHHVKSHMSFHLSCEECLRTACESMKHKYLSVFMSKLSVAQQEFRKSYTQVCEAFHNRTEYEVWWLEALHHTEQNNISNELINKIEEVFGKSLQRSKSSRTASWLRSLSALKHHIQKGLDQLIASRKSLLDCLLEIDMTMENPKEEDIERVRYCPNCQANGDGPLCIHCELDELFQVYEARLFRLTKTHGEDMTSAEEAVDLQKKNSALNRFYWHLSNPSKQSASSNIENEGTVRKRDVGRKVVVSRSPSEVEVALGVIKSFCRAQLGKEGKSAARNHLLLLEGMRKEFAHARSLALAQAQILRSHDEIKMATSRLRLRENEDDKSIDALSPEELVSANIEHTHEKFLYLRLLSTVKGKLRYLEGLIHSKQKTKTESTVTSSSSQESTVTQSCSTELKIEGAPKADEEHCPICQEKLISQKMVFQCGHMTCCKCLIAMTELRLAQDGKFGAKSVICPTCRQHTDFGSIAYADDRQRSSLARQTFSVHEKDEAIIIVQGSYGTKIEAVTRRILWIKHTDPKAKVVVFSSWNDVLDVLAHALNENQITHIRMKGGRKSQVAIQQFRGQNEDNTGIHLTQGKQSESKFIQVLLLLIQHGANGLNLLEAQHVILVEPLLNPAVEAQAISRVHRIGQEKSTFVHRFIVKDTVEESIYKLNASRGTKSFISSNKKNQDQPVLTLKDVESLFAVVPSTVPENDEEPTENLRQFPPSVAAAIAAERRLQASSSM